MAETSRPWEGTTLGDAGPYSDDEWSGTWKRLGHGSTDAINVNRGVLRWDAEGDNALKFTEDSPPSTAVLFGAGKAFVHGTYYENLTPVSAFISANASGNPRIDTIVLRKSWALQTVRLAYLEGTPAVSPVAPVITQTDGTLWEIPLADFAVANGFVTITDEDITDRREFFDDNLPTGMIGEIRLWASPSFIPDGWLYCAGQLVSRFTYNRLFQIVDTQYGVGDGSTTFNLPDLRGRTPIGRDNMTGASANVVVNAQADVMGGVDGEENHTISIGELAAHVHPDVVAENAASPQTAGSANPGTSTTIGLGDNTVGGSNSGGAGESDPHNTMQPWMALNYIIKT